MYPGFEPLMFRFHLALLSITLFLVAASDPLVAESGKPMPLCTVLSIGPCATVPRLSKESSGKLPAKLAGVPTETIAMLDLIVGENGSAHDIQVVQSAGEAFDQIALVAARVWNFEPATYEGKAVEAEARVIFEFDASGHATVRVVPRPFSLVNPERLQKSFTEANQALTRHDYQAAIALSRQLVASAPLAKRVRLVLGYSLLGLEQYDEAEAAFREEIKVDPSSPLAYEALGTAYAQRHQYEDAITQFKKQISVSPGGYDAHASLGILLCSQKRCGEAMPELDAALAISPNQWRPLLAHGECNVDLGNTDKGVSEMEQAANQSGVATSWNRAAYRLAERNVQLELAQKWAEHSIAMASAPLRGLSLDHVTPTQMGLMSPIASDWDTLGWIYFRMGQAEQARIYVEPAWQLYPSLTIGDHLGQIYEKLGRREDARRAYAMAIVAADLSTRAPLSAENLADAKERLATMSGPQTSVSELIKQGHADMETLHTVTVRNRMRLEGRGDFVLKIASDRKIDVSQIGPNEGLPRFAESLRKLKLPLQAPKGSGVDILRRGTLRCWAQARECRLFMLNAEDAFELATKEANTAKPNLAD
jgi:TonB family protein